MTRTVVLFSDFTVIRYIQATYMTASAVHCSACDDQPPKRDVPEVLTLQTGIYGNPFVLPQSATDSGAGLHDFFGIILNTALSVGTF